MLFPEIEPKEQGILKVSPLHSIYWERTGNPNGSSVLIVHGGPGGVVPGGLLFRPTVGRPAL